MPMLSVNNWLQFFDIVLAELRSADDSSVFGAPLTMQVIERIQPLIHFLGVEES